MKREIIEDILNYELKKFKECKYPINNRYQSGQAGKSQGDVCWKIEVWEREHEDSNNSR